MRARARAYGAATIINAIGLGKGAAFGIGLWTEATVELKKTGGVKVTVKNEPNEDTALARTTVSLVLKRLNLKLGAEVTVESNIPIARGLKSSSAASNAVALATVKAANANLDDGEIINLAVDASIASKVTVTGAFDDACASYLGGVVITDNVKRRLIKRYLPSSELEAVLYVPSSRRYTIDVDVESLRRISPLTEVLWREALEGRYWAAMTLNGYIHSLALKQSPEIALEALSLGAVAAGLSGKGPSVVAVADKEVSKLIEKAWRRPGVAVLKTPLNSRRAEIL
ncbi:MAG: shikimate kinase [Candidatus Bathyarchaeia archaeon]